MAVESYDNTDPVAGIATVQGGGITNVATTLVTSQAASAALQGGQFRIKVESEYMNVTAGSSGTSWTVARGQEGTSAVSHAAGVTIYFVVTSATLKRLVEGRAVVASADASYDLSAATGLWLPQSAGAAPANTGQIAHDTTRRMLKTRDAVFGNSVIPETLSSQYANADTMSAATTTNEQLFATKLSLPANYLIANKTVRVTVGYQITTSGTPPTMQMRLKLGSTVVFAAKSNGPPASVTNNSFGLIFTIMGTAAPGASVAVDTSFQSVYLGTTALGYNTTAQPVTLATNGALDIQNTVQWSATTAGNSITLRQLIVEEIN